MILNKNITQGSIFIINEIEGKINSSTKKKYYYKIFKE